MTATSLLILIIVISHWNNKQT